MPRKIKDRSWIEAYLQYTDIQEAPQMWRMWVAITTIASAMRQNVFVRRGFYEIRPNIYTMLVGPSGAGKNESIDIGVKLLKRVVELGKLNIRIFNGRFTLEKLIEQMDNEKGKDLVARPAEAGIDIKRETNIFIAAPELSVLLNNRQSPEAVQFLTDFSEKKFIEWEYGTKTQGTNVIKNACITFLAGSTPEWIAKGIGQDDIGGGFMGRFFIVVQRGKGKRVAIPTIPKDHKEQEIALIEDLIAISQIQGEIELTPRAVEFFTDWYNDMGAPKDQRLQAYFERKHTFLLKLATILSVSRTDNMKVTEENLKLALDMMQKCEAYMVDAFRFLGTQESIISEIILQYLEKQFDKRATERDLMRHVAARIKDYTQFHSLIQTLEMRGEIQMVQDTSSKMSYYRRVIDGEEVQKTGA